MIRILYFASLRERLGIAEENVAHAQEATVADLLTGLRARGGPWADALAPDARVMVAVNQAIARMDSPVSDGDEIAFFPPVTGG